MELFFWSGVVVLSALGLVELVRLFLFWVLKPQRKDAGALVVIPQSGEDCEQIIRAGMARIGWMDWPGCQLVCLNPTGDPNVEAICKVLERRYPNLHLCKRDELVYDILSEKS